MSYLTKGVACLVPALLLLAALASTSLSSAAILYLEDFEGGSPDVSISPRRAPGPGHPDPFHDVVSETAFTQILSGDENNNVLGMEGSRHRDAVVSTVIPGSAPVTTAGYTNLVLSLAIAASAGITGPWESSDFLEIYVTPNPNSGGVEILLDSFRINGADNLASGGGTGVELGAVLQTFLYPLSFLADELSIRIAGRPTSHAEQIAIDNVMVTGDLDLPPPATAPEPGTLALMLTGLIALGLRRRRR